jgi:hypothetical protein
VGCEFAVKYSGSRELAEKEMNKLFNEKIKEMELISS